MFSNRQQAGTFLAQKVIDWFSAGGHIDQNKITVLALPRGGVPVALEVALALGAQLNVLASKKIGAPQQKELAVGAVTSSGVIAIDEALVKYLQISPDYINKEKAYLINKTKELEERWRQSAGLDTKLDIAGKVIIVVDDGVATGMTAIAAIHSLKKQGATQIMFATPIISIHALERLSHEYDQVIALETPAEFGAVGQFYFDFRQVDDMEVVHALTQAMNKTCVKLV